MASDTSYMTYMYPAYLELLWSYQEFSSHRSSRSRGHLAKGFFYWM
jgi:hypothetical protein